MNVLKSQGRKVGLHETQNFTTQEKKGSGNTNTRWFAGEIAVKQTGIIKVNKL
jgi:hypothetical protein